MDNNNKSEKSNLTIIENNNETFATITLRDTVVFPNMIIPLYIGREKSIQAIEYVVNNSNQIFLITQKQSEIEDPSEKDLFKIGTIANIISTNKLPNGSLKLIVEGISKAKVNYFNFENFIMSNVSNLDENQVTDKDKDVWLRTINDSFEQLAEFSKKFSEELINSISEIQDLNKLIYVIASQLEINVIEKQNLLESNDLIHSATSLVSYIEKELDILKTEKKIRNRVKKQMEKTQREYYLNEQVKAIRQELGDDAEVEEIDALEEKIIKAKMPKYAEKKVLREFKKLKQIHSSSPESNIIRNYIDTLIDLPWHKTTKVNKNLQQAKEILNQDHYGLDNVKERILEFLAVQKRVNKIKGPILCLVGPPGVGKTSLGKSIAKATGRKYTRVALGGLHDEGEIRGHRKTYLGSMPGKIIQNMAKVGVTNPLFLLDEIDKIGKDFRGDPASALLEVLDPEQNNTFTDHYIEIEYDLSNVMFIATSNTLNIPPALLDRMEIIRLAGYSEDEKIKIAFQYLIPKQIKENGIKPNEIYFSEGAIQSIIRYYTREAGVRSLEREIARIIRKVVIKNELTTNREKKTIRVSEKNIHTFLGVQKYDYGKAEKKNRIGQVTGLAWTEVGGELLTIEAVNIPGKGNIIRTGKLGEVMQESITASLSVVRAKAKDLGIKENFYETTDLHIHVPEGATPKDGPSAGSAITLAMISSLTNIPVKANVAMTGEITLRGEILPIGGLKEKLLAALRGGIENVLIPINNKKDLVDIPKNILRNLKIYPVQWIDEVINFALEESPLKNVNQ